MQTLIRVGCCARMRRGMPCRTFRGWHATRRVASIGQREVQIQADGRRAAWRAETMQIMCDFRPPTISVATRTLTSGARRNGRRARDAGRSCTWLPKLEPTLVAWTAVLALSLRVAAPSRDSVRSGQVRYITRPKSETKRVTRQLGLPPRYRGV